MNTQHDVLERSFLADHTGLAASNSEARLVSERHPYLYSAFLVLAGLAGYTFLFLFPLTALITIFAIPGMIIQAQNELDVILALSAIGIAGVATWLSWYLFKTRPVLPSGRPLKKDEAPALFDLIEEAGKNHGASTIDTVRIISGYHIETIKTPKNGFPVLHTNTLLIGLPLFQALTPEQLMYAVNREIVHLAKVYKRPYGWAFFLNKTWQQYRHSHGSGWHPAGIVMRAFFCWYAPLFKLISTAACCEEEFYADKVVNRMNDGCSFVEALTTLYIHERYLQDKFWPELLNNAYRHHLPPYLPYSELEKELSSKLDYATAQQLLDQSLFDDSSHALVPPLRHRLERLGILTATTPEPESSQHATNYLVSQSLALIIRQMDSIWQKSNRIEWRQKYRQGQQEQSRLKELQVQAGQGLLSDSKSREYIHLIDKYIDYPDVIPLYNEVLKLNSGDARISFDIGCSLLEHMDALGATALESAMAKNPEFTVMACQLITQYFVRTGNSREAQSYRRRALAYQVEAA